MCIVRTAVLRQESVEMPDNDWTYISPTSLPPRSVTPEPYSMATKSLEMNGHTGKNKKDKKKFANMFKRHKKGKDKENSTASLDLPEGSLGVSIGSAVREQQAFSSLKLKRKIINRHDTSYLSPPSRRRSKSNPNLPGSDEEDNYHSDASSDKELMIATLLNPSLAVGNQRLATSTSTDRLHAPAIRVRSVCVRCEECFILTAGHCALILLM